MVEDILFFAISTECPWKSACSFNVKIAFEKLSYEKKRKAILYENKRVWDEIRVYLDIKIKCFTKQEIYQQSKIVCLMLSSL